MAKQLVLVVRQTFSFKGEHLKPGEVVSDPDEIATIRTHHPEKVIPTMHDVPDAPAPEAAPPAEHSGPDAAGSVEGLPTAHA